MDLFEKIDEQRVEKRQLRDANEEDCGWTLCMVGVFSLDLNHVSS